MICGVHGSPGYSVTEPTWSKRTPAGTALTGVIGFFIWAQPAIPVRAAPATTQVDNNFFISAQSELLADDIYRRNSRRAILGAR